MSFPASWHERPRAPKPGTRLCKRTDIPNGTARGFTFGVDKHAFELLVVRKGGKVWGYVNRCPHFKVAMNARPDEFINGKGEIMCAWHYARFRIEDGYCTDGPCEGMSLMPVPIVDDSGQLRVGAPEAAAGGA